MWKINIAAKKTIKSLPHISNINIQHFYKQNNFYFLKHT